LFWLVYRSSPHATIITSRLFYTHLYVQIMKICSGMARAYMYYVYAVRTDNLWIPSFARAKRKMARSIFIESQNSVCTSSEELTSYISTCSALLCHSLSHCDVSSKFRLDLFIWSQVQPHLIGHRESQ